MDEITSTDLNVELQNQDPNLLKTQSHNEIYQVNNLVRTANINQEDALTGQESNPNIMEIDQYQQNYRPLK